MIVAKRARSKIKPGQKVGSLLLYLGVKDFDQRSGFWNRNEGRLDYILHDARQAYLERIKKLSPDGITPDSDEVKELNRTWTRIKHLFKRASTVYIPEPSKRDHPRSADRPRTVSRPVLEKPKCSLCGREFPRRKSSPTQKFCGTTCASRSKAVKNVPRGTFSARGNGDSTPGVNTSLDSGVNGERTHGVETSLVNASICAPGRDTGAFSMSTSQYPDPTLTENSR